MSDFRYCAPLRPLKTPKNIMNEIFLIKKKFEEKKKIKHNFIQRFSQQVEIFHNFRYCARPSNHCDNLIVNPLSLLKVQYTNITQQHYRMGSLNKNKYMVIFSTKSSSAIRLIFILINSQNWRTWSGENERIANNSWVLTVNEAVKMPKPNTIWLEIWRVDAFSHPKKYFCF